MWLTETPWPPIAIGVVLAIAFVIAWNLTRRGAYLMWAVGLLAACLLVYMLEQQIVTESERVEAAIYAVTGAYRDGDLEQTLSYISPSETALRLAVTGAIVLYDVKDDLRITAVEVDTKANDTLAVCRFRANATIEAVKDSLRAAHPSYWEVTWQKIEGDWKIVGVQRLDVVTGKPIELYSPR